MGTRILHCGTSLKNFYLCISEQVAGFIQRGQKEGDTVYLAVKVGKISYCCARGVLSEPTDYKPWPDSEIYTSVFRLENLEYCEPFNLNILQQYGGKYWVLRYVQASKTISDPKVVDLMERAFNTNRIEMVHQFEMGEEDEHYEDEEIDSEDSEEAAEIIPDAKIHVMATFQTINFKNETDKLRGLEILVNENFHYLFPQYPSETSLLIPDNRLFITSGLSPQREQSYTGIRGVPDALLLIFKKSSPKNFFQVSLIEYECYGEMKVRLQDKSNYLNGHIIPQLMRFASTFSIVTEKQIRDSTISDWADKIINYIYSDIEIQNRVTGWIRSIHPKLNDQLVGLNLRQYIVASLKNNLKLILVIDELTYEQKDTLLNVIKAFKLENNESVQFTSYVVRLEQKIIDKVKDAEYALSVQ